MAISFPRSLPDPAYLITIRAKLQRLQAVALTSGSTNHGSDLADALWMANPASVSKVPKSAMKEWRAFVKSLRGVQRTFLMVDLDYTTPQAYPTGTGWGSPTVAAFDQAAGTIDIQALTAGAVITPGDRFQIVYGTSSHYAYHEVTEGGTADGSGDLTVSVEGPILDGIATSDSMEFLNPAFEAFMLPGSWTDTDDIGGNGSFEFKCLQHSRA